MIHRTRFAELGYVNQEPGLWRFVDLQSECKSSPYGHSTIGPQYKTKAELLADLTRYATEYGVNGPTIDLHNTFRASDALSYADAYTRTAYSQAWEVRREAAELNRRIATVQSQGKHPHCLLAEYRGLEDRLLSIEQKAFPGIVKLDDTDPTPCKELLAI